MEPEPFVTDLGRTFRTACGEPIPRFTVWAFRHEHVDGIPMPLTMVVIDTGHDLHELEKTHGKLAVVNNKGKRK